MKWYTFFLTYLTYTFFHSTKVGMAFNKAQIMETFDVTESYLGLYDFINNVANALGVLIRFVVFKDTDDLKWILMMFAIPVSLGFVTVPFLSYIITSTEPSQILLTVYQIVALVSSAIFGLFSFPTWNIVVTLVSQHFTIKQEGSLLGIWSSCSSFGNVLTFLLSNLMIYEMGIRWQASLFLMATLYMFFALLTNLLVKNPANQQPQENIVQNDNGQRDEALTQFSNAKKLSYFRFAWLSIKQNPQFRYFVLGYMFAQSVVYSFLLWYPLYLHQKELYHVSGYISMLFDVGSIVGNFAFGSLYQVENRHILNSSQSSSLWSYVFGFTLKWRNSIFMGSSIGILLVFLLLESNSILIYCILTFTIGFLICGNFFTIATHESILFAPQDSWSLERFSSITVFFSQVSIGVFQLLIGILLKQDPSDLQPLDNSSQYNSFFYILMFMIVGTCVSFVLKTRESHKKGYEIGHTEQFD